tara:strand:- start:529 stop:771 length:243 start_codon:yes stop_codon:yes gene_type:complete
MSIIDKWNKKTGQNITSLKRKPKNLQFKDVNPLNGNEICNVCRKEFPKDGKAGNAVWAHKCTERISAHMTWEEMGYPSGR